MRDLALLLFFLVAIAIAIGLALVFGTTVFESLRQLDETIQ